MDNVSQARTVCFPLLEALDGVKVEKRSAWLCGIFASLSPNRRGVCIELPALFPVWPALLRSARIDNHSYPLWALVTAAVAIQREARGMSEAAMRQRIEWLAEGMAQRWDAPDKQKPDWGYLRYVVELLMGLAGPDETKFRQMMASAWPYADWEADFDDTTVHSGLVLLKQYHSLLTTIADNFAQRPARCFSLLEKLGALHEFESLRAPLETWRQREVAPLDASWLELGLDNHSQRYAARFRAAKRELDESPEPPASLQKLAAWPDKIETEIEALRRQVSLPPNLSQRLENLVGRLEDRDGLRAAMRKEMAETLANMTHEAELRAAERAVENCYRVRLESLGVPPNFPLDANLLNAALFSLDIESNRKWLREIVRAHCAPPESNTDWRLEIEGNARWLSAMRGRGLNPDQWLEASPQFFSVGENRLELRLENCPLHILQMGNYFGTCLSYGGCNAFSSVANAVELNKRVVFARDSKNRVVGRQLLALSTEDTLLGFRAYTSIGKDLAPRLRAAFGCYARDFAARCGVELSDIGEVERLFVADWYDDGTISWGDLLPTSNKKSDIKGGSMKKNKGTSTPLTGRDAYIARLRAGEVVSFREGGNSMTPRIKSQQKCTCSPVQSMADITVGDAVFCRVGSSYFTHLVTAIKGHQVQISNNHGHINGWTNISHIYGKVIKIEN